MQKQDLGNVQTDGAASNDISLTDLFATLWHSRWFILFITVLVMACGLAGSLYFAKYKSQGFFQFGGAIPAVVVKNNTKDKEKDKVPSLGISLADYKRFSASYATSERFADYLREKKLDSAVDINDLRKTFASRDGIEKLVEPIYPFTKLDAKVLMEQPKDSINNVIGLRINYENSVPEDAQNMVSLLGRYVMDSIVYLIYMDELQFKHSEIKSKMIKLDNVIITNKEQLEEYRRKGADLKQIVTRYPESANQASRQVLSVTEDSARYLSPVTQLVTTEVQTSEAKEAIFKAKREQQQITLLLEYYDRAKVLLDGTKSGETVLRGLDQVKESVFKGKNMEDEVIKEAYNTITIENQNAINVYLEKSRFIAGPTLPTSSSVRPSFVLLGSLMLGLFLSILLVFGRNLWRDNRMKISV